MKISRDHSNGGDAAFQFRGVSYDSLLRH